MSNEELEELETDRETPGESEPDTALRWIDCFGKRVNSPTVVPGSPQLVDGTCNEDKFADPDAGGLDLSIVARRVRRWMIVGITVCRSFALARRDASSSSSATSSSRGCTILMH